MKNIISQFAISNEIGEIKPLKIGFINDSYIVKAANPNENSYFLQKINHHIFTDVSGLQQNIQIVTDHLREKLRAAGEKEIERKALQLVPTKDGKLYYQTPEGDFWRVYILIKQAFSQESVTPQSAYMAGQAFGRFQCMLSDIAHDELIETIPNFHNMEFRLQQFHEAVQADIAGRVSATQDLINEIEKRAFEMCAPERLFREGKLPKRINHCDTKVNNILFDENGNVLCIVDLDTVMPGFVLSDFGDFMRTAANNGKEDDENLTNVSVNLEIFKAYTKGYLEHATFLTQIELDNLAFGAKLLSYMQTVRFFTDYLNGDTYYKISSPKHNLQRTKAQLALLRSQEAHFDEMQQIVRECSRHILCN